MKVSKSIFRFIILLLFLSVDTVVAIGWYKAKSLARGINSFSVFKPIKSGTVKIYFVTEGIATGFKKNQSNEVVIKAYSYNGKKSNSMVVARVRLDPSPTLFPLHPRIAVHNNKILVVWQETNLRLGGTRIKYSYSSAGLNRFSAAQELPGIDSDKTAILPIAHVNNAGNFYIFFQEERSAARFTLMQSIGNNGTFADPKAIVKDIRFIGRGVFFPSVVFHQKQIEVIYQNRLEQSLRDELYKVSSNNNGLSYQSPQRITTNNFNDFSPSAIYVNNSIEVIWQANPDKAWSVFLQRSNLKPNRLSSTNASCYLPDIAHHASLGRVAVWYDTRIKPGQIFGLFLDRENNQLVGKEYNISVEKSSARNPLLISALNSIYLFYQVGNTLKSRKADNATEDIKIKGRREKGRGDGDKITFRWKTPKDISGVESYAYLIDSNPESEPEIFNLSGRANKIKFENMTGSRYYFHLRYKDKAGNYSRPSRYSFVVDNVAPAAPVISSSTHTERVANPETTVKLRFNSIDDSGIKRYWYAFSPNRAAKPKRSTDKSTLELSDNLPNSYYFIVQAEDYAGNRSKISSYQVDISQSKSSKFFISSNVVDGKLISKKLQIDILLTKDIHISKSFFIIANSAKDAFRKGKKFSLRFKEKKYNASFSVSKYSKGIYAANFAFTLSDGDSIKRTIFFEKAKKGKLAVIDINIDTKTTLASSSKRKSSKKKLKKKDFKPKIFLSLQNGIYKVQFKVKQKAASQIKGYSWQLTSSKAPQLPNYKINSLGGPEYIYGLEAGEYYLSVRPILSDKKRKMNVYQYRRFKVENAQGLLSSDNFLWFSGLIILLTFASIAFKSKIAYYLARFF